MRRRDFIKGIVGSTGVWPIASRAQQPAMPLVGAVIGGSADVYAREIISLRRGLNETGYVEGQNVTVEYHWLEGRYGRLPALMADLVRRKVAVIAATNAPTTLAAKAATTAIPIVFNVAADPIEIGLATSLNRPGGNLTGVTTLNIEVGPKRIELLHELIPATIGIAFLVNPANPAYAQSTIQDLRSAAQKLGLELHVVEASKDDDFDKAFATIAKLHLGGLAIGTDAYFVFRSERLAALALKHAVPTIFQYREFVEAGGLMSYGSNLSDTFHHIGVYIGRILKGEQPSDLSIVQSTKVELLINNKTAKRLGLTVPLPLLGRADEVIE